MSWNRTLAICCILIFHFDLVCDIGIADRSIIADRQLSASSNYDNNWNARNGRLHNELYAWHVKRGNSGANEWIQVDLERSRRIVGISTQGRSSHFQWMSSYSISYKMHSHEVFSAVLDDRNATKVFQGNTDGVTVVRNDFDRAVKARYWRVIPLTWRDIPTMKFELHRC